ncbi:MAG: permease prefix domain 1-containing protein [Eubacteriales bacterium]
MSNRYEKLDNFLNDAFRGSPNTLEANELKVEIATNLRQMYDELLASGLSEEEALARTCDSLGSPEELFGPGSRDSYRTDAASAGSDYRQPTPTHTRPIKPPASPLRPLIITIGILLCALCWLPTAILAVSGVDQAGWIASPILPMVSLGVFCFIYAGSMRLGASLKTKLHYTLIGLGVGCEISCAVPVMLLQSRIGVSLLLVLVGLGIVLIVGGAMIPTDKWDSEGIDPPEKHPETPLEKSIWLITLAVYLLVSFLTGAWAVTWILFLIGSAVKSLIRSILELKKENENDTPKI